MSSGPTPLLVLFLATAASGATLTGCSDDPPTASSPDLAVIDIQPLDLPPGDAYLSPDGSRIATYTDRRLCVHDSSGVELRCAGRELDIDPNSIRWSPDSSRLVYSDDFWPEDDGNDARKEPDIWAFQARSGAMTDLTDDGVPAGSTSGSLAVWGSDQIDTMPTWVDESTIRFLRWRKEWNEVAVMEMPATGGRVERIGALATKTPPEVVAYSPTGRHAAYERQLVHHDVVVSTLGGRDVEPLTDVDTQYAVSFSSDGGDALGVPAWSDFDPWNASTAALDPTVTTSVGEADQTELDEAVQWAAWRPDGTGLVYAEINENGEALEFPLRIVSDASDIGDDARELSDRSFLPPYPRATYLTPVWSEQNTMLLREQLGDRSDGLRYVLVHLGDG